MVADILYQKLVDVLAIGESKIDSSFPDAQFLVDGYRLYRRDRTTNGGGVLVYVRADIPSRRIKRDEPKIVEALNIELVINSKKWLMLAAYKTPTMTNKAFSEDITLSLDNSIQHHENLLLIGDLNFDMLCQEKSKTLKDICDIFDLTNLIKTPTCFTKNSDPSLVDVILTNRPRSFNKPMSCDTGLSDCHHLIACVMKCKIKTRSQSQIQYRCFKSLDECELVSDVSRAPLHVAHVFDDIDDVYWAHGVMLGEIIDRHIPMKVKKPREKTAPFMNGELRKAINFKKKLRRTFQRCKSPQNWEKYRIQRNMVTKLKRESIKTYFMERCAGGPKSRDFWPTIKPFLGNGISGSEDICLLEDNAVISNQTSVSNIFNNFFVSVADNIGRNLSEQEVISHPSILKTLETVNHGHKLVFRPISASQVDKYWSMIGSKKATGLDNLSVKVLNKLKPALIEPITCIINAMFIDSSFPAALKEARVTPIFKKDDTLKKDNYRPISILPIVSKLFERAIADQLSDHFREVFHPSLSAYRKGYSCQSALIALTEEWRWALDRGHFVGAILMDLSKAFDCLPHALILAMLKAYNVGDSAVRLINSYLTDRKQCVRIGSCSSDFLCLQKGVPQGSILGPLIFNTFINDIFYFMKDANLCNYADDNTISYSSEHFLDMKQTLETEAEVLIDWFSNNQMQANPAKFQGIAIGKKTHDQCPTSVSGVQISNALMKLNCWESPLTIN